MSKHSSIYCMQSSPTSVINSKIASTDYYQGADINKRWTHDMENDWKSQILTVIAWYYVSLTVYESFQNTVIHGKPDTGRTEVQLPIKLFNTSENLNTTPNYCKGLSGVIKMPVKGSCVYIKRELNCPSSKVWQFFQAARDAIVIWNYTILYNCSNWEFQSYALQANKGWWLQKILIFKISTLDFNEHIQLQADNMIGISKRYCLKQQELVEP